MGGPVAVEIGKTEWPKREQVMATDPVDPVLLEADAGTGDVRAVIEDARRRGDHS